jgi:hypothetical protein
VGSFKLAEVARAAAPAQPGPARTVKVHEEQKHNAAALPKRMPKAAVAELNAPAKRAGARKGNSGAEGWEEF